MSLPRELLEDLLSGYMDGELSADENARVEQMLATDPAVREQLRTLQEQAEGVRAAIRSAPPLGDAFAERVLAAMFAEAERSDLDAAHPVRLAAAAPARSERRASRLRWSAMGGLAIAASLTAAVILLRDDGVPGGDGQPTRVATNVPAVDDGAEIHEQPQPVPPERVADASQGADGAADGPAERIAVAETPGDASSGGAPLVDAGVAGELVEDRTDEMADAAQVAVTDVPTVEDEALAPGAPATRPGAGGPSGLRAVLVYQVQVTPLGRERGVINRAMREADIRIANHREVDDALVGYLQSSDLIGDESDSPTDDGSQVSVLFLEGSAKKLEKLMLGLLEAGEEIRSVGFALAMDPPIMAAIDTLDQVNPTAIRTEPDGAVAHSLIPAEGEEDAVGFSPAFPAGNRDFMPMRRDTVAAMSMAGGAAEDGQSDITARTLMVIRFE